MCIRDRPMANPPVDTSLFVRRSSFKSNVGDKLKSVPPVDSTALNEMIVMEYKGQKKKDTLGQKSLNKDKNLTAANYKSPLQQLVGQAPGVTVSRNPNYNTPASVNGVDVYKRQHLINGTKQTSRHMDTRQYRYAGQRRKPGTSRTARPILHSGKRRLASR